MTEDIKKQDDVLASWIEAFQEQKEPASEFTERYMEKVANAQNMLKVYKVQYEKKVHNMEMYLQGLDYVHGQQFRNETKQLIAEQPGAKKTYEYDAGSAGFRSYPEHIEFTNVKKAKLWMIDHFNNDELVAAISGITKTVGLIAVLFRYLNANTFASVITGLNKTPFAEYIKNNVDKETGEVKIPPGVELINARDKFTINNKAVGDTPILPKNDESTLLYKGGKG